MKHKPVMKRQTRPTPGPWRIAHDMTKEATPIVRASDSTGIALLCVNRPLGSKGPSEQELANARLIIAAPQLVKALRKLQQSVLGYRTTGKPNYKAMSKAEDEAHSLLRELGET